MQFAEQQKKLEERLDNIRAENQIDVQPNVPVDVQNVLETLHEHQFDSDVNVSVILDRCGIQSNTFFSRFKCYVGTTPKRYLESLRICAAMAALRAGHFDINCVAFSVGYENRRTFERAFRRHVGCTPGEFENGYVVEEGGD